MRSTPEPGYRALFDLTGRTAIVTGAVGILGRRFCRGLADFGANVVVADLQEEPVRAFAEELERACGVATLGTPAVSSAPCTVPMRHVCASTAVPRMRIDDARHWPQTPLAVVVLARAAPCATALVARAAGTRSAGG